MCHRVSTALLNYSVQYYFNLYEVYKQYQISVIGGRPNGRLMFLKDDFSGYEIVDHDEAGCDDLGDDLSQAIAVESHQEVGMVVDHIYANVKEDFI